MGRHVVRTNNLSQNRLREGGHGPACKVLVLLDPFLVVRIGMRNIVKKSELWRTKERSIDIPNEFMSTKDGKELRLPQEIVL